MKPRLLVAADVYPDGGGISAIIENIVAELQSQYELDVAIVDGRPDSPNALHLRPERIHVRGSKSAMKPYLMPTSLAYSVVAGRFLRSLVKRLEPNALLVQDGLFLPIPALIAVHGTTTKLAVMDHGTLTNSLDRRWQRLMTQQLPFPKNAAFRIGFVLDGPWRELRWRIGLRHADAVWYVGRELQPLLRRAGARAARYAQLVPTDFAPPTPVQRAAARASLGVSANATVINIVTRLAPEKGLDQIVDSLASTAERFDSVVVFVVGDGPLSSWLAGRIRELDLPIRLLGRMGRSDIAALHHGSDFHLYAGTIGCGMSIALLEAMASGVVPIVSDVPAEQRDLVGDAGWVFEAGDAEGLLDALVAAILSTEDERESMRARAIDRVRAYRKPSLVDRVAELLRSGQPGDAASSG